MATTPIKPTDLDLADEQAFYAAQVVNLINVARQIRAGQAEQVAAKIEAALPTYLREMETHASSPFKTVAFYGTGLLYQTIKTAIPPDLEGSVAAATAGANQALSADCYEEITCLGIKGCTPWPTSLHPVDVNTKNPMGWRYIVDSHCGFSWPKFWNLGCGPPIGLIACTGSVIAVGPVPVKEPVAVDNPTIPVVKKPPLG